MSEHSEFFLNRAGSVVQLECLEVAHPSFAETYYIVRNAVDGVTVAHEDSTEHDYRYVPLMIERGGTTDDLDQSLRVSIADMGNQLADDIDAVLAGEFYNIKPKVKYRIYASDYLLHPKDVLKTLEVANMSRDNSGSTTFVAMAQQLNNTKTGMIYDPIGFKGIFV